MRYYFSLDEPAVERRQVTWRAICQRPSQECCQMALVFTCDGVFSCIVTVIATDSDADEMRREEDLEMIRAVHLGS